MAGTHPTANTQRRTPNTHPTDELLRLKTQVAALSLGLAEQRRQVESLEDAQRHLIPAEDVQRELDRFNLPRRSPAGYCLVLAERFALLRVRLELER